MHVVHIEAKPRIPEADATTLETALAAHVGRDLTAADASVISGLPLDAAEAGLIVLAGRYPSRLRVTDKGILLFRFASLKRPRGPSRWSLWRATMRRRVVEPAIAWLTILVGPFLLASLARDVAALGMVAWDHHMFWLALLPCLAIGAIAALVAVFTLTFFLMLPLTGVMMAAGGAAMIYLSLAEPNPVGVRVALILFGAFIVFIGVRFTQGGVTMWLDSVWRKPTWARALWTDAIVMLAGAARPHVDRLADERQLAALIRDRRGVIALGDLIGLSGGRRPRPTPRSRASCATTAATWR